MLDTQEFSQAKLRSSQLELKVVFCISTILRAHDETENCTESLAPNDSHVSSVLLSPEKYEPAIQQYAYGPCWYCQGRDASQIG